jgi:hypothetical protein
MFKKIIYNIRDMKSIKIEKKEIFENVFHLKFSNYREIKQACMRFEEAYENPIYNFKKYNKKFTKEDIKKWWKSTPEGKKSPYWFGAFNIPSYVIEHFFKGKFDPLDRYEQAFLNTLRPVFKKRKKFYVITTVAKPVKSDFMHEFAHGLYYISKEYQNKADKILKKIPKDIIKKLDKYLNKNGYGKHVFLDEKQAILISDSKKDFEKKGIKFKDIIVIKRELEEVFEDILGKRK